MPIRFYCEKCHKPLEVSSELAGQQALCFHCKSRTNVPESSEPELLKDNVTAIDITDNYYANDEYSKVSSTKASPFTSSGVIGLMLAGAMIVVLMTMFSTILSEIKPVITSPEFKKLSEQQQAKRVHEEIQRITHLPKTMILASSSVGLWLAALIFSLVGLIRRKGQMAGLIGLVICSGILLAIIRQLK